MGQSRRMRAGATAVEFAVVAPVFFLMVFGLIEVGRMVMVHQSMTDAAREGCRVAALASNIQSSFVEISVRNQLRSTLGDAALNPSKVRIATTPANLANVASESDLTVAVEVDYADASWLPMGYLGLNPTIGAEARRRRE